MDFLEKLDYLMDKNSLNKSTLSKACDIPYTTIDGWYKKGYEGLKLTTLRKLASFFGTSLDFWANDNPQLITIPSDGHLFVGEKEEVELLRDYRILNALTKTYVKGIVKGFAISERIANRKGETLSFPTVDNPVEEITKSLDELGPEYQQAVLELAEQLVAEQEHNK